MALGQIRMSPVGWPGCFTVCEWMLGELSMRRLVRDLTLVLALVATASLSVARAQTRDIKRRVLIDPKHIRRILP